MFDGHSDHRRFNILLVSTTCSLIVMIVLYAGRNVFFSSRFPHVTHYKPLSSIKQDPNNIFFPSSPANPLLKSNAAVASAIETWTGVLSSIEFTNSPFLQLSVDSADLIPIFVLSKSSNTEIRDAIRRTWAFDSAYNNETIKMKVFFIVGTDDYMTKRIRTEQQIFDDVIHVSMPDTNSFAAYRELSAMIWLKAYLPKVSFYIKTEDDAIFNMQAIIEQLIPIVQRVAHDNVVVGWFGPKHSGQRGSYQRFINAIIPPKYVDLHYAMSLLYVITSKAVDRMLDALSHVEVIEHPGDPFVTGVLREAAHIQIANLASFGEDFLYVLSDGSCKDAFTINSKLLFCTSSLHNTSTRAVPEYFEAWNLFISSNQSWLGKNLMH